MEEGKYVVTANGNAKVFSSDQIHAFQVCDCPEEDCPGRAVSAGFFTVKDGVVRVFGRSTTLGVESHPDDAEKIKPLLTK